MKILDKMCGLFESKARVSTPEIIPQPGETWVLNTSTGGPWPSKGDFRCKILDVKSGWVRYEINPHIFNDERMELDKFTSIYQKAE